MAAVVLQAARTRPPSPLAQTRDSPDMLCAMDLYKVRAASRVGERVPAVTRMRAAGSRVSNPPLRVPPLCPACRRSARR